MKIIDDVKAKIDGEGTLGEPRKFEDGGGKLYEGVAQEQPTNDKLLEVSTDNLDLEATGLDGYQRRNFQILLRDLNAVAQNPFLPWEVARDFITCWSLILARKRSPRSLMRRLRAYSSEKSLVGGKLIPRLITFFEHYDHDGEKGEPDGES